MGHGCNNCVCERLNLRIGNAKWGEKQACGMIS